MLFSGGKLSLCHSKAEVAEAARSHSYLGGREGTRNTVWPESKSELLSRPLSRQYGPSGLEPGPWRRL